MNQEKLTKLQAHVYIYGKGTTHWKKVIYRKATAADKKLQFSLKKLETNNVSGIEDLNVFTNQGTVTHFSNPKVQASLAVNTFKSSIPDTLFVSNFFKENWSFLSAAVAFL